jgi:Mg2+ and Co2+ transporter CorA
LRILNLSETGASAMGFLRLVTNGFINFFGITQPTPRQERQAAWFICGLLVLIVLMAALVFTVIVLGVGR